MSDRYRYKSALGFGGYMDIFTTQLTRVVPVPIKPASLKVKALVKDSATDKLTDDIDHFENHDQYFKKQEDEHHQQASSHEYKSGHDDNEAVYEKEKLTINKKSDEKNDDEIHHLELFI